MATSRSLEMIRYNTVNGVSSYEDQRTVLSRYDELMTILSLVTDEQMRGLYEEFKRREKIVE